LERLLSRLGYRRYDNSEMAAVLSRYTGMMGVSPSLVTIHPSTRSSPPKVSLNAMFGASLFLPSSRPRSYGRSPMALRQRT